MTEIVIRDVPIRFPFEPYKVQKDYMSKVLECLQKRVNGVLESPTGTGKTLSLLCASLAWLEVKKAQLQANAHGLLLNSEAQQAFGNSLREKLQKSAGAETQVETWSKMLSLPTIIYASRTHAQLTQVMKELKRTNYAHVKSTVLGSRDQLCLHPDLAEERGFMKVTLCRAKVKAKACHYHNVLESKRQANDSSVFPSEVTDIEDLVKFGHRTQCCPYFTAREMMDKADIVFMPYNYLLDSQTRRSQRITLENCVVLLDEGHNVEKTCEEAASVQITSTEIALCIMDVTQAMKKFADNEKMVEGGGEEGGQDFTMEELMMMKTMFLALETAIDEIQLDPTGGKTFPGSYIFEILAKAEIVMSKVPILDEYLTKLAQFLSTTSDSPLAQKGGNLLRFLEFLKIVNESCVNGEKKSADLYYKVHIEQEQPKRSKPDSWASTKNTVNHKAKVINFWCFSPGFAMRSLVKQNIHCVILTSGTLSPLQATISELGIDIPVQLENPHIIQDNQICVMALTKGPTGERLISTYNNRDNPVYLSDLGRTVINFCRVTPEGILIFFASFPVMEKTIDFWQKEGIWSQINALKTLFVEPRGSGRDSLEEMLREYHRALAAEGSRGAVLLAVLRGKVSEGIDFADAHARAVIVTGIPYPPLKDPRVILKQEYVDVARKTNPTGLTGKQWYELDAVRAVNQAVGRVIRHSRDFGAILLCDCRYSNPSVQNTLSMWLRSHLVRCQDFGPAYGKLSKFFRAMGINPVTRAVQSGACFDLAESKVRAKPAVGEADSQAKKENQSQASMKEFLQRVCSAVPRASPQPSPRGLLDALDTPADKQGQKVVDFRKVVCERTEDAGEGVVVPAPKRRKLRVEPLRFSANNLETDAERHGEPAPGPSTADMSAERKVSSMEYILKVKSRLANREFLEFKETIKGYAANSVGYDSTVLCLKKVFPNSKTMDLFMGFKRYIKKEHSKQFEELCHQQFGSFDPTIK